MRYRYYIVDTMNGTVFGCENDNDALDYAMCEEFYVIDTATGYWITNDGPQSIGPDVSV